MSFSSLCRNFSAFCFCLWFLAAAVATAGLPEADGRYAVVVSQRTHDDLQWKAVVEALISKHHAEVITYKEDVDESLPSLQKLFPRYICFVAQPEEASRPFVVKAHRLTRRLNDDPYTDALWGIITGYNAKDALRIAKVREPLVMRKGAGGTAIPLDFFEEGVYYDETSKNTYFEKKAGGPIEKKAGSGDDAEPLVEVLNKFQPDIFLTSGHATERDWQIGYPRGNEKGMFLCKNGVLFGLDRARKHTFIIRSSNPKVLLAWGNCLMGHVRDRQSMALAWMHSAGVDQLLGYVVSNWYNRGGWGTRAYLFDVPGRYTLSEAFFFNNQGILYDLETRFPKTAHMSFPKWNLETNRKLLGEMAAKLTEADPVLLEKHRIAAEKKQRCPELTDNLGLLWDRDTIAFYGDPAWEAKLAPCNLPFSQELVAANGVHTFRIHATADVTPTKPPAMLFPVRLKNIEITAGKEFSPLITTNFIMLMNAGKFEKGKTYEVVFKAEPAETGQTVADGRR